MGLSRKIRFAAAAASISLVAGPAAFAAPPPSAAAATAAQMQSAQLATADLAAKLAAQRQALAQQTAQRHQAQLQAIKAALVSGVQPLAASRPGVRSLAPGIAPMGTVAAKSLTFSPPIAIQQLSVTEGDPGTPVLLTGAGFGDTAGEVHFVVASGRDIKATTYFSWTAGQVATEVPYVDGVPTYNGYVYVQRADGTKSPLQVFRFKPVLDVVVLVMPECYSHSGGPVDQCPAAYQDSTISEGADRTLYRSGVYRSTALGGFSGTDQFYQTWSLKNEWTVATCDIHWASSAGGRAEFADCRPGTPSPRINIRWALSWGNEWVDYAPRVTITGPKGLPYF
jgi:hypothetical protein